jgi:hypothetical protein
MFTTGITYVRCHIYAFARITACDLCRTLPGTLSNDTIPETVFTDLVSKFSSSTPSYWVF